MLAVLLLAPVASAQDGALPPECTLGVPCDPFAVCVSGASCVPNPCGPVLCEARAAYAYQCDAKPDIEGETCQRSLALDAGVSFAQVGLVQAQVGVALTDGGVRMLNLRNAWFSHAGQAGASVAGVDSGTFSVAVYRSDIETSNGEQATQVGVAVARSAGGLEGSALDALVGVVLVESQPRACFVRVSPGAAAECPPGVLFVLP